MSELHARLKTVIEERLALAKAATPGPWHSKRKYVEFGEEGDRGLLANTLDSGFAQLVGANADFIAAHDPADAIRRHEAALRSIEIHHPFAHRTGSRCVHCQDGTEPWPCGEFEIVAGAYGVPVEVTP